MSAHLIATLILLLTPIVVLTVVTWSIWNDYGWVGAVALWGFIAWVASTIWALTVVAS